MKNKEAKCQHDFIVRDKDGYQFYESSVCVKCGAANPEKLEPRKEHQRKINRIKKAHGSRCAE